MAPYSDKSKRWREKNKENVKTWRELVGELRNLANLENWSYEKLEIEIAQKLHPKLREIFDFASSYAREHKSGKFRKLMADVDAEIIEFGTVEPSRFYSIKKAIEGAKRRMNEEK